MFSHLPKQVNIKTLKIVILTVVLHGLRLYLASLGCRRVRLKGKYLKKRFNRNE
jgi:hypothetical protein